MSFADSISVEENPRDSGGRKGKGVEKGDKARGMWEREGKQRKRGQEAGWRSGQGTTLLLHVASQDESEDTSPLAEAAPGWVRSFMRRAWT